MRVLITGGSGSLGSAIVRKLANINCEVRILSRNEKNQDFLAREIGSKNVKFYIGDIRNRQRISDVMRGCDTVIHCAALKYVPICISNPWEAIETNIIGTKMLLSEAVRNNVKNFVAVSTDKAASPVSAYGYTKALMECMVKEAAGLFPETKFVCVRLGNLIKSRGSVYEIFRQQIEKGKRLTITDPEMTRFFITLSDAATYVLRYDEYKSGSTIVPKIGYCTIGKLAQIMSPTSDYRIIGGKPGEKLTEALIANEKAVEKNDYYEVCDDGMNMSVTTLNSRQLTNDEIKQMIKED